MPFVDHVEEHVGGVHPVRESRLVDDRNEGMGITLEELYEGAPESCSSEITVHGRCGGRTLEQD